MKTACAFQHKILVFCALPSISVKIEIVNRNNEKPHL